MRLQDVIHKLTAGSGARALTVLLVFFGMVGLGVWYDLAAFRNLATIEGMDGAQLARHLSQGDGFVTDFVRPFSVRLLKDHREAKAPLLERHPDLANAPLYPVLLAGALRLMPFAYPDLSDPESAAVKRFGIYVPDLWIAMVNQLLFFLAVWLVFRLAKRLLDDTAAWLSAGVLAGSDLFWRLSLSGLSTMLLAVLFLALVDVLSRLEPETREGATRTPAWLGRMAALAGVVVGLAGLTRYGCAFLIVPVVLFLVGLPGRRGGLAFICVVTFVLTMTPWVVRNWLVSGTPFGTAGYAVFQTTTLFPGLDLERSLNPDFSLVTVVDLLRKMVLGLREVLEKELPRLGGSWVTGFFLAGLLVPFRSPTLGRLRNFLLGCLGVLALIQAAARTGLSTDSPEINSENLLVVVSPLVFVFGVSLFLMLVGQFGVKTPSFRGMAMSLFMGLAAAPLLFSLFMPVRSPLAYPPYFPPHIQEKAHWMEEKDVIMSDMPWAVAWYGQRQSIWLSLKYREDVSPKYRNDFYSFQGMDKPIGALYLSARTLKTVETQTLVSGLTGGSSDKWEQRVQDWDSFLLLGVFLRHEIPSGFPLKQAPFGLYPELFLAHSERNSEKPIKE